MRQGRLRFFHVIIGRGALRLNSFGVHNG